MKEKRQVHQTDRYGIVEIDIRRLDELGHPIFITNRAHEFTTDFVPPECITWHYVEP